MRFADITPAEAQYFLQRSLPQVPQGTFYDRNSKMLWIIGSSLFAGVLLLVLMVKI